MQHHQKISQVKNLGKWIREHYNQIVHSIAFYPAVIAFLFLVFSWLMLVLDFSAWGKAIKSSVSWIQLKDASTARSMTTVIAGGIISLTVFSFSMVMIVLNQAASKISNRTLDSMIGNKFQQIVLGFYIGTIVYALFLLSTIRDIHSGVYVPALSIYVLVFITVVDVFLFIYFLHYVTQTVKFETIIQRIHQETLRVLQKRNHAVDAEYTYKASDVPVMTYFAPESGYFQNFNQKQLIQFARKHDVVLSFLKARGSFVLKGTPLLEIRGSRQIESDELNLLTFAMDFYIGQPIGINPFYGFYQLAEVAIKSLSPGINDPATAVLSLNALADLFAYYLFYPASSFVFDKEDALCIRTIEPSFSELFHRCISPIWHYGKQDPLVQQALASLLQQLRALDIEEKQQSLFSRYANELRNQIKLSATIDVL